MKDFLNSIVDKSKVNYEIINTRIKHPILTKVYPKRNLFVLLEKYAKNFFETGSEPRMIGVSGIKGTGKTTLKMVNEMQVYLAKTENAVSPDLVIETKDKPILLEICTSKLKTGQLKQKIDKRYGILVSKPLKKLGIEDNIVKIPLKLFLLL